jgi:hypothetical protein
MHDVEKATSKKTLSFCFVWSVSRQRRLGGARDDRSLDVRAFFTERLGRDVDETASMAVSTIVSS